MPTPPDRSPAARPAGPARRALLRAGLAGGAFALTGAGLAGCGTVRLGSPEPYVAPPPGIDDLYRADLLTGLDALRDAVSAGDPRPETAALLRELDAALVEQRAALLTGAEAEASESSSPSSSASPSTSATASPSSSAPTAAPGGVGEVVTRLGDLVALGADACVQCSGSFARVVAAIAAHAQWSAGRLALAAQDPAIAAPAVPAETDLVPAREVPATDPPSVAAATDYHSVLACTQGDEWYAGYAYEVLAAQARDDATRTPLLAASGEHRDRARRLAQIAGEDGAPDTAEEPVYPLPGGGTDPQALAALPAQIGQGLVVDWVALVGAAPFARRALAISTALAEAQGLAALGSAVEPLPSLTPGTD
ncbi:DUF4439 domain-containing protein [Brachybacterium huguangmaarense]